ncbi:MAG: DUF72 domain-containing protein [Bacteroidota bacterium]
MSAEETVGNVRVYVGMGGWDLPPFDGRFYPAEQGKGFRKLRYYSRYFDMVEVNATFYSTSMNSRNARRWLDDVSENPDFVFAVKMYQGFTHTGEATKQDETGFKRLVEPIASDGKLEGIVMKFPSSFRNSEDRRKQLAGLARRFSGYRSFVEVRHDSWNSPAARKFLEECGFYVINTDLPRLPHHMPFLNRCRDGIAYYRMMGRNAADWYSGEGGDRYHYYYSPGELKELIDRINEVRPVAEKVYVVFHNDPNAHSPVNGFQVRHILTNGKPQRIPGSLERTFPVLKDIEKKK